MATKKQTTALAKWDEELAKAAQVAAGMEANTGGGQFFGLKSGVLTWQDAPLQNNEMAVIILDFVFETVYYEGQYDPDTPQSPVAFAFGRDEKELRWHETSIPEFAGKLCHESEVCQWGSADRGRGKAARETRRLAMIPAGQFDKNGKFQLIEDEGHFEKTTIGFMKLPVTSVTGFAGFVKQVAGTLKRPPFGIITKVKVIPDAKSQFKVTFEPIEVVPDELMSAIFKRHEEAKSIIEFPYTIGEDEAPAKKTSNKAQKPASRTAGKRKY